MISFKEYKNNASNSSESILSWASSNAENREYNINESTYLSHNDMSNNNQYGVDYDTIHDHPNIKPKGLTEAHIDAILHYTATPSNNREYGGRSSGNMNMRLRQGLAANKDKKKFKIRNGHTSKDVDIGIKELSATFTPENTNRQHLITHCGIPPSIGNTISKSAPGSTHVLAGFTSTSTDPDIARYFSAKHARGGTNHRIQFNVHPGAGLSIAKESMMSLGKDSPIGQRGENEVLLHHGAHAVYSHTEKIQEKKLDRNGNGVPHDVYIHHMDVYPEHKPLSEYGKYEE